MKYSKLIIPIVLILALTACGGEAPAPTQIEEVEVVEPSDVVGMEPSTDSSEEAVSGNIIVTEIDQIVGTWIAPAYPGNFVLTILPDGKLSVATSLVDLESGSTDSWDLEISDGLITATGFALCMYDTGSYVGEIDSAGNLRFVSLIDGCDGRLRKMDRSLPGRLYEYKLVYRPVE